MLEIKIKSSKSFEKLRRNHKRHPLYTDVNLILSRITILLHNIVHFFLMKFRFIHHSDYVTCEPVLWWLLVLEITLCSIYNTLSLI